MSNSLEVVTETPPLETMERADTPAIWSDFETRLKKLEATAKTLTVAEPAPTDCALARATRLSFKELRVAIEKKRKELGDQYLRKTQRINADAKQLKELIEPFEEKLLEIEQYEERQEAKRRAELKVEREAKVAAIVKAEQDRLAKEKAEAEERERIRLENERLKAEAERQQAAKEKAEAEAQARKEREALEAKAFA